MAAATDISTLIARRPGVYGGRPCLAGTRFPVLQIAVLYNEGVRAEEIHERHPELELSGIYAGIAYYLANKHAIDEELEEEDRAFRKAYAAQEAARAAE